jgi:hypothetical protein
MSGVAHSNSASEWPDKTPESLFDVEPPVGTCALCGESGHVFWGAVELPDGAGGWTYDVGWRCVESLDCRERRHQLTQR